MKTKTLLLTVSAILSCSFQNIFAQHNPEKQDTIFIQDSAKIIFTCPMHPEVISDEPGTCPKCGMELIKAGKEKTQAGPQQHQMGMMMCQMHGMVDMNHKHDEQRKGKMNMMKGMGIVMGVMMIVMLILVVTH